VQSTQFEAVIFDMDGVIVDSEPLHEQSFLEVWDELGYGNNHGIHLPDFYGRSDRVVWEAFIEKHNPTPAIEKLIGLRVERLIRMLREQEPLFDGVTDLIQRLAKRYPLGLASGSIHRVIDEVLAMQNLRYYFKDVTSSEDVPEPKPSPEIFLLSAKRLGVPPEKCCVIEDTVNGIKAGKAAGMNVIAIPNTFAEVALKDAGVDHIFSSYPEIDNYFSKNP
tara:strand:+ start:714 stop:1376 length:663 start_codon:yes stop_codon:yes gene_type:complete